MFQIKAYFVDNKVYVNDRCYHSNEILTAYLNLNVPKLEELLDQLYLDRKRLPIREADYEHCKHYNRYAEEGQNDLYRLGDILKKMPPYDTDRMMEYFDTPLLFNCLNSHFHYWVYPGAFKNKNPNAVEQDHSDDEWLPSEGAAAMYGRDDDDNQDIVSMMFYPDPQMLEEPDAATLDMMNWTNEAINRLLDKFILVAEDILRVKKAYSVLLDQYIHDKNRYLTEAETAAAFNAFLLAAQEKPPLCRVTSGSEMQLNYEVYTDPNGDKHLCEAPTFNSLGAFLYYDFFRGLSLQSLPRRCSNCGQYFLQRTGKYSSYCERPLKEDKSKTCRDIGAKKKYADKCKTDPVWLAYNRAYKAHYARYMKKKMTTAEFEQWSRYAIELRDKALAGELDLEEYTRDIKR